MGTKIHLNPRLVVKRLEKAMNDHDVDAFVQCFDPLYHTEQPTHPDRAFRGREKIREEWSARFKHVPNFKAEIIRIAVDGDVTWTEWHWYGTQTTKKKVDLWGVTILGVRETRFVWGRLYMEPVQEPGGGIESVAAPA